MREPGMQGSKGDDDSPAIGQVGRLEDQRARSAGATGPARPVHQRQHGQRRAGVIGRQLEAIEHQEEFHGDRRFRLLPSRVVLANSPTA